MISLDESIGNTRLFARAIRLLFANPRRLLTRLFAEFRSFRPLPPSPVQKRLRGVLFEFDFEYDPVISQMYHGTYEMCTVSAMKRFLKEGDTFIDVGANIGYLSAIAMGLVGKRGWVHSFEPVPDYAERLKKLARANAEYRLIVNQCALGERDGTAEIAITRLANIGWNTMVPGLMTRDAVKEAIEVRVGRLDKYARDNIPEGISLIKIDTEALKTL